MRSRRTSAVQVQAGRVIRNHLAVVKPIVALGALLLVAACVSYTQETAEIRRLFRSGDYATSLKKLDESDLASSKNSRLLYLLERAMILDRMGLAKKSRAVLLEADRLADKLYTVSVSKTALTFVYNDSAADYAGEDYERIAIHTQLALSFIGDGDYKAARVEAAKINNLLHTINQKYDADHKNKYGEDAFARYLSGIVYESRGEWDDAIIDYRKALKLYQGDFAVFVDGGAPDSLVDSLYLLLLKRKRSSLVKLLEKDFPRLKKIKPKAKSLQKKAEIVVVHEVGAIAYKRAKEFVFQVGSQVIRASSPYIQRTSPSYGKTGFVSQNNKFVKAEQVQNMNEVARISLEDKRFRIVAKQTARLLAKGQLTEQARQNFGVLGGIAANIVAAATETADTRSWTLLPSAYYISRHRVEPGTHMIKIYNDGKVTDIEKVALKPGQIKIFRGRRG